MKNLQLKAMEFGANEILTRQQLKNTVGGYHEAICQCNNKPREQFTIVYNNLVLLREYMRARCPDKVTSTMMPFTCRHIQ